MPPALRDRALVILRGTSCQVETSILLSSCFLTLSFVWPLYISEKTIAFRGYVFHFLLILWTANATKTIVKMHMNSNKLGMLAKYISDDVMIEENVVAGGIEESCINNKQIWLIGRECERERERIDVISLISCNEPNEKLATPVIFTFVSFSSGYTRPIVSHSRLSLTATLLL